MNEIMMPLAICENFTFSGIKRSRVQVPKESMHTMEDSNTMDSNISHFSDMNDSVRKNPDVDVSESNSDSIISEILEIPENVSNAQIQVAEGSKSGGNNSCAKYKTVSVNIENMTKTTVINTSFNIISQSTIRDIEKKGFIINSTKSPIIVNDPFDKSRVVVQVLTSNAKSQTVIENETCSETPNVSSFRDDVCKILSKVDASKNDDNESNSVDMSEERNCVSVEQNAKEDKLKCDNTTNVRSRRKRNLKFFFLNGRGIKFNEIEYVASNLRNAQPRLLRILHYLLFDTYGSCSTGLKLSQTMRNILHFCGYPFSRNSEDFQRKRTCLLRLPLPILYEIHKAIIGNNCSKRSDMVAELVEFLMEPQDFKACSSKLRENSKDLSAEEYIKLMNIAVTNPQPTVLVKKLNDNDIEQLQHQIKSEYRNNKTDSMSDYQPPIYILNGPGRKLKSFPKIVNHVQKSTRRIIEILHLILYGRMEHLDVCRRNILEFSGFLPCQKDFITQTRSTLTKLGSIELSQLCRVLCLHAKTNTRIRKIEKIMKYLSAPSEPVKRFERAKKVDYSIASVGIQRNKEDRCERTEVKDLGRTKEDNHSISTILNDSKSYFTDMKENETGPKLRDFSKICSNVECAAPSDLLELNDLLFIKPSDESEIHQRILDFTRFKFSLNSMEYHYRKTLMHYMGFCITRKIAQLLDIENWEKPSSQEDLSSSILNFLMEMKLPVSALPNLLTPKSVVESNFWKKAEPVKEDNRKAESVKKGNRKVESIKESNRQTEFQKETVTSEYFQFYKEETEKSWSFLNGAKPTENASSPVLPHSSETHDKNPHDMNQIIRKCRKEVFIHRLSKASEQSHSIEKKHDPLGNGWSIQDDSTPLCALIHHPSDEELEQIICEIIKNDLWDITMGDLVRKVYCCYPKINLHYREDFIKAEARQILAQMRSRAVHTLNNLLLMPSS